MSCKCARRQNIAGTGHHRKISDALGFQYIALRSHEDQISALSTDCDLGHPETVVEGVNRKSEIAGR